jgi:DNA-directed RNA polymerase subunit RPC12/RpoP
MEDNVLIICRICQRKVLMHNMVPDSDGENMICSECAARKKGVKNAGSVLGTKKELKNEPYVGKPEKKSAKKEDKLVKYICGDCKYKFSRKASQEVVKCPYCGKSNILTDNQMGADNLIKESLNKRFDW